MFKALRFFPFIAFVLVCNESSAGDSSPTRYEERNPPSANDFGGIGLLQTRTARFGRDGQFDVGVSDIIPYRRFYLSLIALPGVEATFRYSDIRNRKFIDLEGSRADRGQTLKDRGADLKVRILEESKLRPAVAIGLQDGVGTGVFQSEYIVASKRYKDFDFSLGLGWGNLGAAGDFENPLISLLESFRTRGAGAGARTGGQFNLGNYFSGERVALFGGVEYQTPFRGLTLKAEYDGNDYQSDPQGNILDQSSRFNYGFNYRPFSWIDFSAAYERGEAVMLRASLRYNFNDSGIPNFQDPPPPPVKTRPKALSEAQIAAVHNAAAGWQAQLSAYDIEPRTQGMFLRQDVHEFFSSLESQGYEVTSLEIRHEEAIIHLAEGSATVTSSAALAALRSSPLPLEKVTFHRGHEGANDGVTYEKQEVINNSAIDSLFAAANKWDLEVTDVEISNRTAVVWVVGDKSEQERYQAARDLAASLVDHADLINVVANGLSGGASQVSIRTGVQDTTATSGTGRAQSIQGGSYDESAQKIFDSARDHGLIVEGLQVSRTRATVYVSPIKYREVARNVGRAARLVANNVPADVEEISVVLSAGGLQSATVTLLRKDLENALTFRGSKEEVWANATFGARPEEDDEAVRVANPDRYPSFQLSITPRTTQYIGDAGKFILYGVWLALSAGVEIAPGVRVRAIVGHNLFDNFDKITITSDSVLTRVRSEVRQYLQDRETWIEQLQADYMFSPLDDFFVRVSAGIFEQAYAGYGGEFLYRPFESRWALGADLNWVRQREFIQHLGLQDYRTLTGHVNVYYQMPWYDLLATVNAGRYLAKDKGATFALSRSFDSGIRAGAFFTLTNVSAEDFGEGSFDKGFFLVVPFQLFLPTSTGSTGKFGFRPLTRDGGQMLIISPRLYDVTSGGHLDNLVKDWDRLLD